MDERELIRKSRSGDEEAFSQLLSTYRPRVLQHCISLLQNEDLAEDLIQEASLRAYQHLAHFRGDAQFGTWFWRIAHNLCLDQLRKKREITSDNLDLQVAKHTSDEGLLTECLDKLPFKQRQVFELYYVQRLSGEEIAKQLRIPHGTVRSRLYYARRRLRKFLS